MGSTKLTSYAQFERTLDAKNTNVALSYSQCDAESVNFADTCNGVSNGTVHTKIDPLVTSHYDEDFEVDCEEEVRTPRTSPTLDDLRKVLASYKSSAKSPLPPNLVLDLPRTDTYSFITKSLSDVSCRPCQYSVDKLYDESIPVQSNRRVLKDKLKLNSENLSVDKVSLLSRKFNHHLEGIGPCPTSPLSCLSPYVSSSGSLIGNINGLSLPMGDNLFSLCTSGLSYSPKYDSGKYSIYNADDTVTDLHYMTPSEISKNLETKPLTNGIEEDNMSNSLSTKTTTVNGIDADSVTEEPLPRTSVSSKSSRNTDTVVLKIKQSIPTTPTVQKTTKSAVKSKHPKTKKKAVVLNHERVEILPSTEETKSHQEPDSIDIKHQVVQELNDDQSSPNSSTKNMTEALPPLIVVDDGTETLQISSTFSDSSTLQTSIVVNGASPTEESEVADDEFTLVTNKKAKRKQRAPQHKNTQQQSPHTRAPSPSRIDRAARLNPNGVIRAPKQTRVNAPFVTVTCTQPFPIGRSIPLRSSYPAGVSRPNPVRAPVTMLRPSRLNIINTGPTTITRSSPPRSPESGSTSVSISSGTDKPTSDSSSISSAISNNGSTSALTKAPQLEMPHVVYGSSVTSSYPASNSVPTMKQRHVLQNFLLTAWDTFKNEAITML